MHSHTRTYLVTPHGSHEMLATLTTDENRLMTSMQGLAPKGKVDLLRAIQIAWVGQGMVWNARRDLHDLSYGNIDAIPST